MGKIKDILGHRHGKILIVEFIGLSPRKAGAVANWKYRCDCGFEGEVITMEFNAGQISQCRKCQYGKRTAKYDTGHPLYVIWTSIKQRCYNPNNTSYHNYGGRGVTVCDEWNGDYQKFYDWCLSNGWQKGLKVDKDKKGGALIYSPETCSIITQKENNQHKRSVKLTQAMVDEIRVIGKSMRQGDIGKMYGVSAVNISTIMCGRTWNPEYTRVPRPREKKPPNPRKATSLVGQKDGKITIVARVIRKNKGVFWKYVCDCGNEGEIISSNFGGKDGIKQCQQCARDLTKAGYDVTHPLYPVWTSMKQRCYTETDSAYFNYGARGVEVCREWRESYKAFYDWCMANGWEKGLFIDKDTRGTGFLYSPETCAIVTRTENNRKRRGVKLTKEIAEEIKHSNLTIDEMAEKYNTHSTTIRNVKKGLTWVG